MKASNLSDAQKAFILRQGADGVPVADICRKAGISQASYFNWKKKYDGLQPPEMRRLKQLEDENAKLKKIVADLALDREMLQDVSIRPDDFSAYCLAAVDTLLWEADSGRSSMLTIGFHLRISGRPARFGAVETILDRLAHLDGMLWIATRRDIAHHFAR
jgi:putative transposase